MKYYACSDIHGYYTQWKDALKKAGYFDDVSPNKKVVVCGDLLDRGKEPVETVAFAMDLLAKDELIFVKGNHEDLLLQLIDHFSDYREDILWGDSHHNHNGTWESALSLANMTEWQAFRMEEEFIRRVRENDFVHKLIPKAVDFYETDHFIFTHGFIPTNEKEYRKDWRNAEEKDWNTARWANGIDLSQRYGVAEPGKIIVCGHIHASYGHHTFEGDGTEFGKNSNCTPFTDNKTILALDACTPLSKVVNVAVIKDSPKGYSIVYA